MIKSGHLRRLISLGILLGAVFVALGARLVELQVLDHERLQRIKEANTQRSYLREPRRGDILDINGNPLATCVPVKRVLADPSLMSNCWPQIAHAIAPLISYDEDKLAQMLRPTIITNRQGQPRIRSYVDLHRKVSLEEWEKITETMAGLRFGVDTTKLPRSQRQFFRQLRQMSIYSKDAHVRFYPNKNLAAHVLGYTQENEDRLYEFPIYELVGGYGIEQTFDKQLTGVCGWRVTETDGARSEISLFREQDMEARPGLNVILTIDMVIQNIVEQELAEAMTKYKPISVQAVVARPRTGEILAMATLPNFDPNESGHAKKEDYLRNRVIADMIEPGSTFKVILVSGALNDRLIALSDTFDCERGQWLYCGRRLHDGHGGYGILTVEEIIAKSSNIGAAKIAVLKVGKERLYNYIKAFGFGAKTGIPLQGELNGWVHDLPDWDKDKVMITRVPIGQSVTVTPLQLTMAFSAVANGGRLMRPMLVNRLQNSAGEVVAQYHPVFARQVISEQAAKDITTAMKRVTTKDGTAIKAALEHYTVAGKTGTAWKVENGQYGYKKYVSSFIGFFPADTPELCITVVMDEPDPEAGYYGGQTTAPVFKSIAEQIARYLQLRPDREVPGNEPLTVIAGEPARLPPVLHQN